MSHYDINLDKNKANYVPLTPLSFLERAKDVYPNYEAIVYEDRKYTWSEVYKRVTKFASALEKIGIKKGDTVSFLAFNTPEIFEAHYSVPMTGGVLNTINIRLDANTIAYILNHSEAKVLVVDRQLHIEVKKALKILDKKILVIDRFTDSTLAYQHYGMGIQMSLIIKINKFIIGNINPDITFINLVNKKNLKKRLNKRLNKNKYDKFNYNFYSKVQNGFIKLSRNKQKKYFIINSNNNLRKNKNFVIKEINKILKT